MVTRQRFIVQLTGPNTYTYRAHAMAHGIGAIRALAKAVAACATKEERNETDLSSSGGAHSTVRQRQRAGEAIERRRHGLLRGNGSTRQGHSTGDAGARPLRRNRPGPQDR